MTTESEWIDWAGGKCPLAPHVRIEVKLRDDETNADWACNYQWKHDRDGYPASDDIIAYRVVQS